mgnify:CR=1 FL=1
MKTGGTQVKPPAPSNNTKFNAGDVIECTHSTFCGYIKGKPDFATWKENK